MKRPILPNPMALLLAIELAACGSEQPHSGTPAMATGGAPSSSLDAGGTTAATTHAGATSVSAGGSSDSGGTSSSEGGASSAGGASSPSSNAGAMSSGGATHGTGGSVASTGGSSAAPGLASRCSAKAKAGASQPITGVTLDATSRFAAVTPDELTLVWTVPSATGVTVYVADRTASTGSWNGPQSITDVPAAEGQVAVTPDGLVIAYVDSSTRRTFASMSRTSRSSAFQFADPMSGLDFDVQNSSGLLANGDSYAYPVYGPHLTSFYYAIKSSAGGYTWYLAGRFEPQGVFTEGAAVAFASPPAAAAVLSGVASDENTLFFVDASTGQTSWSFYDEATTKFGSLSALGALGFVQPTQACSRLYGSLNAGSISLTQLL